MSWPFCVLLWKDVFSDLLLETNQQNLVRSSLTGTRELIHMMEACWSDLQGFPNPQHSTAGQCPWSGALWEIIKLITRRWPSGVSLAVTGSILWPLTPLTPNLISSVHVSDVRIYVPDPIIQLSAASAATRAGCSRVRQCVRGHMKIYELIRRWPCN